jgi:ribosome assembly protein 4
MSYFADKGTHKPGPKAAAIAAASKKRKQEQGAAAAAAAAVAADPQARVNIIAQLEDAEGNPTGPQLDLPADADPKQLEELLNTLLANDDKVPFAFFAADAELIGRGKCQHALDRR